LGFIAGFLIVAVDNFARFANMLGAVKTLAPDVNLSGDLEEDKQSRFCLWNLFT